MVKKKTTTVTTYNKKRYWRRKKVFNNYFRAMCQVTMTVQFIKPEGQDLVFGMFNNDLAIGRSFLISTLLQSCPTWPGYKNLFTQFYLRGFGIIATPSGNNSNSSYPGMIKIGLVDQTSGLDWRLVEDANYGVTLSPITCTRTYVSMVNKGIGYIKFQQPNDLPGALQLGRSNEGATPLVGMHWSLELRFYVTFKQNIA